MSEELLSNLRDRLTDPAPAISAVPMLDRVHTQKIEVTVSELRAAVENNPRHEVAKVYSSAIKNMDPSATVIVEAADLQALLENGTVVTQQVVLDGQPSIIKSVVPTI